MLIIDEPIFEDCIFWETALNIEKFSMPHVSGIQTVSGWNFERCDAQSKTWLIVNIEPKLYESRMILLYNVPILVYLF